MLKGMSANLSFSLDDTGDLLSILKDLSEKEMSLNESTHLKERMMKNSTLVKQGSPSIYHLYP